MGLELDWGYVHGVYINVSAIVSLPYMECHDGSAADWPRATSPASVGRNVCQNTGHHGQTVRAKYKNPWDCKVSPVWTILSRPSLSLRDVKGSPAR